MKVHDLDLKRFYKLRNSVRLYRFDGFPMFTLSRNMKHTWQKRCCGSCGSAPPCFIPSMYVNLMSTKICRFVPVVWLRHVKKRTQNGGVYILEMRVRQAGKMPLKNFDLWLSRNIVTFEHSKLGPVQGVEVLSKDSFNVQHFYTIIQSHGFICW